VGGWYGGKWYYRCEILMVTQSYDASVPYLHLREIYPPADWWRQVASFSGCTAREREAEEMHGNAQECRAMRVMRVMQLSSHRQLLCLVTGSP